MKNWTDSAAESSVHVTSPFPSSSLSGSSCSTHPRQITLSLYPGSSTPLPAPSTPVVRWWRQPLSNTSQGHQDTNITASMEVSTAQVTITMKRPQFQSQDLNWEGGKSAVLPQCRFRLGISGHLHGPTSTRASIFGTGWGDSSAAECSQSNLAGTRQSFSKRLVLQLESGRTLLFSEKCCPCLFLMKADLVFTRSRPELFQIRKTADTNQ